MIGLSKYIVITTDSRKVYWTIINHEFYKWFNYLVKTYKVDQDNLAHIFYSRGMSIKRKLLVNRLIIILKTIGVDINTVNCIISGRVAVKIREDELIVCLKDPLMSLLLRDSPLTVNLIKFYKYQKNDNSTRARGRY